MCTEVLEWETARMRPYGESVLSGRAGHRPGKRRVCRLRLRRDVVAIRAIHPGEHLAEELKELEMSAAELARQLDVPTNRVTEILNGRRAITGDTALSARSFLRDNGGVLAQLADPIRAACCAEEGGEVDRPTADSEARRGSACIAGFIPRLRCGRNCSCPFLNDNASSICKGFSVRARPVVSCPMKEDSMKEDGLLRENGRQRGLTLNQ